MKSLIVLFAILFSGHAYSTTFQDAYCSTVRVVNLYNAAAMEANTAKNLVRSFYHSALVIILEQEFGYGKHTPCKKKDLRSSFTDVFRIMCTKTTTGIFYHHLALKQGTVYMRQNLSQYDQGIVISEVGALQDDFRRLGCK